MYKSLSKKVLREFGFLIGLMFPIFVGWIIPIIGGHPLRFWTLYVSAISILTAILKPNLLLYPYKIWMKFGLFLGWFNSRVILGMVFILVLQPIALLMKVFGYDPLRIKKRDTSTYREIRTNFKIDLKKIF